MIKILSEKLVTEAWVVIPSTDPVASFDGAGNDSFWKTVASMVKSRGEIEDRCGICDIRLDVGERE